MTEWLGLPPLAAAHGGEIDNMIGWIHIFMLVLFVGWGGFLLYTLFRFRQSRSAAARACSPVRSASGRKKPR